MGEPSTTSNATEKKKPGPKPKAKPTVENISEEVVERGVAEGLISFNDEAFLALSKRVANLENCLSKMAHFTGTNRVLDEFGIDRWEVTKDSMRKNRG